MLLNCGVGEDSWESLGLHGDPTSSSWRNQSWIFIGRTDAEAETPILWPPGVKNWLIWKDPDAGKNGRWEEKGVTEDEMVGWHHRLNGKVPYPARYWGQKEKGTTEDEKAGWHHRLNGHQFEWTPGVGDGQGGLACCNSWGRKELDTTERLNWTELRTRGPAFGCWLCHLFDVSWAK